MAVRFSIPENIVVHLGEPNDASVGNVTVPFISYIKNVASSEIYPTWPESAIRANMYAQVSFVLNRLFTEYYRVRGYNFDITNSTQYDQAYVYGRDIFENISRIADEMFNDYIVRSGDIVPLYARYCNGTTSTCPGGMSQWGSVELANKGYTPYQILKNYYGDISIIENAPIADENGSYKGQILKLGTINNDVKRIQLSLNRISKNYPTIPKIEYTDGVFDLPTENAVKEFQNIFNLEVDGIVGKATWYKIFYMLSSVKRLSEIDAEIIDVYEINREFKGTLEEGDKDKGVRTLQYFLSFIAEFNDFIPQIEIDGDFGPATKNAVKAFQQIVGLPQTGVVDEATWNAIYSSYKAKYDSLPDEYRRSGIKPYPGDILFLGDSGEAVATVQTYLRLISETFPSIPKVEITGVFDEKTQDAVLAFTDVFDLPQRGFVDYNTWVSIATMYSDLATNSEKTFDER